jgi:hypothetical protein
VPQDPSVLGHIRSQTVSTGALFLEAIEKWPNNDRLGDEYSMFLVEGARDFAEGMKVKHRAELIQQSKNFVIDISFRSQVHTYSQYLKLGIIGYRGNSLKKDTSGGDRSMSSSSLGTRDSQLSTGTMFSFHRLAYQRALESWKCSNNKRLKASSVIAMAARAQHGPPGAVPQLRYAFDLATSTIVTHWPHSSGLISDELFGNSTSGLAILSESPSDFNLEFDGVSHPYDGRYWYVVPEGKCTEKCNMTLSDA